MKYDSGTFAGGWPNDAAERRGRKLLVCLEIRHYKLREKFCRTQMLAEIGSKPGANIQGSVIILGDESCGKTSLLYQMTKKEYKLSSALEYSFLNIQSDYKDDSYAYQLGSSVAAAYGPSDYVNLPVYLLNGRTEFAPLLKFAFPQQLNKCCFVLMASLVPPENIIPSLEKWYKIIEENVKKTYDEKDIEAGKQQRKFLFFFLKIKNYQALFRNSILARICGAFGYFDAD